MNIALFFFYVFVLMAIGLIRNKKNYCGDHYFVNGRHSSALTVAASILAACIGASATIGMIGLAFNAGMPAFWWLGSGAIGLTILGFFFAAAVRKTACYTLSDIVAHLLGGYAEKFSSIVIVFAWTAIVTAELVACTTILQTLLNIPKITALVIGCALIGLHTIFGGQGSIIRLDKLQFSIIFITIAFLLIYIALQSGYQTHPIHIEFTNHTFSANKVAYFCFVLGGGYIVCPMLYGRVLSANNKFSARNGVLAAAVALAVIAMMIVFIGLLARNFLPADTPSDQVLIKLVAAILPGWLTAFIDVFLLCVVVSSADACLFAASSALSRHLCKKTDIRTNRWCTVILMIIAALLTLTNHDILSYLLMANNVYVCSIVIPVMLSFTFHKTASDINQLIVLTGMIVSGLLGLMNAISDQFFYAYLGLVTSLLFTLFSFLGTKTKKVKI